MSKSNWLTLAVLLQSLMFTLILFSHQLDQNVPNNALSVSIPYAISKAAGTALHINLVVLLLPVCHSLRWILRNTLGRIGKLEDSKTAHNIAACSILVFSLAHAGSKWAVFAQLSIRDGLGTEGFALVNFATGVGWSGHAMLIGLVLMLASTVFRSKISWAHHLLRCENSFRATFFALWATHEAFCIPDWSLHSFAVGSVVFWKFWIAGAMIYLMERMLLLGLRSKQKVRSTEALVHSSATFC